MGNFTTNNKLTEEEKQILKNDQKLEELEYRRQAIMRAEEAYIQLTKNILKRLIDSWNVDKRTGGLLDVYTINSFNFEEIEIKLKQVGIRVYFETVPGELIQSSYGTPYHKYYVNFTMCDDSKPKIVLE